MEALMFDVRKNLGVQSYCFRNFKSIPALIEQVQQTGLHTVELCAVHADFNDESSFPALADQFQKAGIQISSIGVQKFTGDLQNEEKWFRFCELVGAKLISATFPTGAGPELLHPVEQLALRYGIKVGIHNHGGYDWLGNSAILLHVFETTDSTGQQGSRIGLCLDTAWCLQAGENPLDWVTRFADRLYGIHLKDFIFDRAAKWSDVILGTGNLNLPQFLHHALTHAPLETLTIEYEGDPANPVPKLLECVEAVRHAQHSSQS
jgi:inosose dehydratase